MASICAARWGSSRYPWSVLWRAGDSSEHVSSLVRAARTLSQQLGWLEPQAASQAQAGRVIGARDEPCSDPDFPRATWRGWLGRTKPDPMRPSNINQPSAGRQQTHLRPIWAAEVG